jgi:hypothetical protein
MGLWDTIGWCVRLMAFYYLILIIEKVWKCLMLLNSGFWKIRYSCIIRINYQSGSYLLITLFTWIWLFYYSKSSSETVVGLFMFLTLMILVKCRVELQGSHPLLIQIAFILAIILTIGVFCSLNVTVISSFLITIITVLYKYHQNNNNNNDDDDHNLKKRYPLSLKIGIGLPILLLTYYNYYQNYKTTEFLSILLMNPSWIALGYILIMNKIISDKKVNSLFTGFIFHVVLSNLLCYYFLSQFEYVLLFLNFWWLIILIGYLCRWQLVKYFNLMEWIKFWQIR